MKIKKNLYKSRKYLRRPLNPGFLLLVFLGMISLIFNTDFSLAYAMGGRAPALATSICPGNTLSPTTQSLLVVLLDRSGSLTQTDRNGYSTSTTKALIDLWPGKVAVIPFGGDTTSLPVLGPFFSATQRAFLKQQVQHTSIGGNTPLAPAMSEAISLLLQQHAPASRVVIITDGEPAGTGSNNGQSQEQLIRADLIPRYCSLGVPIGTFGLTIDLSTAGGRDANHLLTDIASGTGGTYADIIQPEDLARVVIGLYAQWQHITFAPVSGQGSNFSVAIDQFAQEVSFITFRSNNRYHIALSGPDDQIVQTSTVADTHYEIDTMIITKRIVPGFYTLNTGGDPNAQVYVLIRSPLQVRLVAPAAGGLSHAGEAVRIEAEFFNGTTPIAPNSSDGALIVADVLLLVNGRAAGPPNTIVLTQQNNSPLFSGLTPVYNQIGQLQINLVGTYQNVSRQSNLTLQLLGPLSPPSIVQQHGSILLAGSLLLIFLLLAIIAGLIIWRRRQPGAYGYLTNGRLNGDIALEQFKKRVISSRDLERMGDFDFEGAKFELRFERKGGVTIKTIAGNVALITIEALNEANATITTYPRKLRFGNKISIDGEKVASFEPIPGRRWL